MHANADGSFLLSQQKYVDDLLLRAGMSDATISPIPMVKGLKLSKDTGPLFSDPQFYRSIVGGFQYLTVTRPDICFAVNRVCQFMQAPTQQHWQAVKKLLRYVKGTSSYGLVFTKPTSFSITSYCDSDWGADFDDRRSTTGFCIFLGDNLIS